MYHPWGEGCLSCEQQHGDRSIRTNLNHTYRMLRESMSVFWLPSIVFQQKKKSSIDMTNRISKKVIGDTIVVILCLTTRVYRDLRVQECRTNLNILYTPKSNKKKNSSIKYLELFYQFFPSITRTIPIFSEVHHAPLNSTRSNCLYPMVLKKKKNKFHEKKCHQMYFYIIHFNLESIHILARGEGSCGPFLLVILYFLLHHYRTVYLDSPTIHVSCACFAFNF